MLFGFLLAIRFTGQFDALDDTERYVYYATLLATAVALVLFLAPAAHHRLRFREGDKDFMLRKGNREAIAGTAAIAVAFTGVVYLITALVFGTAEAIVVAIVFFAFIAWRWWTLRCTARCDSATSQAFRHAERVSDRLRAGGRQWPPPSRSSAGSGVPKLQYRPSGSLTMKPRVPTGESWTSRTTFAPAATTRSNWASGSLVAT